MGPFGPPLFWLHHRLEQRAEDRWRYGGPVEPAGIEQGPAHGTGERGDQDRVLEQGAVDVREAGQVLVQRGRPAVVRGVQHLEQLGQQRSQVEAVRARAGFEELEEDVAGLEDAGVVGKQAEHGAHQEQLQVVSGVAGGLEFVVQAAHELGGLDVDRILILEGSLLPAQEEAKPLDVLGQVGQREGCGLPFVKVVQFERPEVADQQVPGPIALGQGIEVGTGLVIGLVQVAAGALLLDQQHTGPEQVDVAGRVVKLPDMLLETGHRAPLYPEHVEEVVVEAVGFALLVDRVLPVRGELGGANADLIPGQIHGDKGLSRRTAGGAGTYGCKKGTRCR